VVGAQVPTTRPTPEQAQILLQTRPDLVSQLRQRFATSGLTREQVHARLRAEGYPEDLLDPYLPGMSGTPTAPGEDVFSAVRALGIADSADVAAMQEAALLREFALHRSRDHATPRRNGHHVRADEAHELLGREAVAAPLFPVRIARTEGGG